MLPKYRTKFVSEFKVVLIKPAKMVQTKFGQWIKISEKLSGALIKLASEALSSSSMMNYVAKISN